MLIFRSETKEDYNEETSVAHDPATQASSTDPSQSSEQKAIEAEPPNGGIQAWNQALVAHMVIFNTWGYINSFGVFQTYYVQVLGRSVSEISWIGSLQVFLLFFIGAFSGRATDAGLFRHTFVAGTVFLLLGLFATSFCTQYWQLLLAQGLCVGIGSGILFCPTIAIIPTYFSSKRSLAIGIAASGTTTGGMVIPGLFKALLPRVGFGWTVRILAFVTLTLQIIGLMLARTRIQPRKSGRFFEFAAFKEPPYVLFTIALFLSFWSFYPAFFYVGDFAVRVIGLSQQESFNFLLVMNGIGAVGRLLPPWISDRYTGPVNIMIPFTMCSAITLYAWIAVDDGTSLWVFSAFYGLFSSGINALFPTALSYLTDDLSRLGTRMGMVYTIISFATLTGTPIAGALIRNGKNGYLGAQIFTASIMAAGGLVLVCTRIAKVGWKLKVRM